MKGMSNFESVQSNYQNRFVKMRQLFDVISPGIKKFPDRIQLLKTFLTLKMQGYFKNGLQSKDYEMVKILYKVSGLKEKEIDDGKIK